MASNVIILMFLILVTLIIIGYVYFVSEIKYTGSGQTYDDSQDINKQFYVYHLNIPKIWKFDKSFPKNIAEGSDAGDTLASKIWYVKKQIRYKTHRNQLGNPYKNYVLPKDLCLLDKPANLSNKDLDYAYQSLKRLYSEWNSLHLKNSDQRKNRGLLYLFTGDEGDKQYYGETMKFLKSYDHKFSQILDKYLTYIFEQYKIKPTEEFLNKHVQIILLKYNPKTGIWMHIDNIARYDQGPIITIPIGPEYTYYDFTPTLSDNPNLKPMRIKVKNGSINIMDGDARMEWAHGLPYDMNYEKTKYTIMFKCDKFDNLNPHFSKKLDTMITSSGHIC